ncbi:MAG: hypothetical protein CL930_03955, partial [Deltaproteobacteria bacterium]|nr:hypothetical protein [Deltaproteobacteria bacterium]
MRGFLFSVLAFGVMGCADTDSSVKVVNSIPTALITSHSDGSSMLEGDSVMFVGNASDDDNVAAELEALWQTGSDILCDWSAVGSGGTTSCDAVITVDMSVITLVVRDPRDAIGSVSVTIDIGATDAPTATISSPLSGASFYSDQSIDLEGVVDDTEDAQDTLTVSWQSDIDGALAADAAPDSTGTVLASTHLSEGEHFLTMTATDSSGKSGSDSVTINVGPANSPPVCALLAPEDGASGPEGDLVVFVGEVGDVDIPADSLAVSWSSDKDGELGASTPTSAGAVSFPYGGLSVDTHVISMTVADDIGVSCTDNVIYTVSTPPTVEISNPVDASVYTDLDLVRFSANVNDNEDFPTDLTLEWSSSLDGTLSTASSDSTGLTEFTRRDLSLGSHDITLTVTDTAGLFSASFVSFPGGEDEEAEA